VVQAVKRFGGEDAAKNFQTAIGETQRVVGGLIGNPMLGGGETDQKLKQSQTVWGANPTIKNLISTGTVLKDMLGAERDSYMRSNRYLRQQYGNEAVTGPPRTGAQTGGPPPPAKIPTPANLPAGARPGVDTNGNYAGYQDASGWHPRQQ
jgi:hypothetical protein